MPSSNLQIRCKACGLAIPAEDVNLDTGLAKCRSCQAVFGFLDQISAEQLPTATLSSGASLGELPRPLAGMPQGYEVQGSGKNFSLTHTWRNWSLFFFVPFTIFWLGFLVVWYAGVGAMAPRMGVMALVFLLFPLIHVAVGIGLAYTCVAMFVNRTIIRVDGMELTVRMGPLPFWGNKTFQIADILQLYCKEVRHRHHDNDSSTYHHSYSYEVHVLKTGNTSEKLLGGFITPDQAIIVEQQLEQALGIADRRVPGDVV